MGRKRKLSVSPIDADDSKDADSEYQPQHRAKKHTVSQSGESDNQHAKRSTKNSAESDTLHLKLRIDEQLKPSLLPSHVTKLIIDSKEWNFPLKKGCFDSRCQVTHLTFNTPHFNSAIGVGALPHKLESLDLTNARVYNQTFRKGVLPKTLKVLKVGPAWNCKLSSNMFESCLKLEVLDLSHSKKFNQKIRAGDLPERLKKLYLPASMQQQVRGSVMPETLEYLSLNRCGILRGHYRDECRIMVEDETCEIEQRDFAEEDVALRLWMHKDDHRNPMDVLEQSYKRPRSPTDKHH